MKILVTGGDGLLAHWIRQRGPGDAEFVFVGHGEFDLTKEDLMVAQMEKLRPDVVINTAAYNLVDRCEVERELSWAVNATGPQQLAQICATRHCKLVHFSTDYVFDGEKRSPYVETDSTNALNHYAAGKLFGEDSVLRADARHLVLRTSWVFGGHPTQTKSYVHTVLRAARAGGLLRAATDQCSVPTFAPDLALWTMELVAHGASGLFHAVNDEGVSRYDWTRGIVAAAAGAGLLAMVPEVEAVTSVYFSSTMKRPVYTVMSNGKAAGLLGHPLGSWRGGLEKMLAGIGAG